MRNLWIVIFLLVASGCATEPMSYDQAVTANYTGNNQFEINSVGNVGTEKEVVRQYFYRKAYEICSDRNKGFKIISKNFGDDDSVVYTSNYCSSRQCYPGYYSKKIPVDSGVIECDGEIDPGLKNQYSAPPPYDPDMVQNQSPGEGNNTSRSNAFSAEILGRGWLYSVNYDHLFGEKFAIGAGFSYWSIKYWWTLGTTNTTVVPVYANYYFVADSNRFFVTAGADIIFTSQVANINSVFQSSGVAFLVGGGYEYRGSSRLLFRIAPYLIFGSSTTVTVGASLGGLF